MDTGWSGPCASKKVRGEEHHWGEDRRTGIALPTGGCRPAPNPTPMFLLPHRLTGQTESCDCHRLMGPHPSSDPSTQYCLLSGMSNTQSKPTALFPRLTGISQQVWGHGPQEQVHSNGQTGWCTVPPTLLCTGGSHPSLGQAASAYKPVGWGRSMNAKPQ